MKNASPEEGLAPGSNCSDVKDRSNSSPTASPATHQAKRLSEPLVIDKFWRDRSGRAIFTRLTEYKGRVLVDLRTFYTGDDGTMQPGKGLACNVRLLPELSKAVLKAVEKARELGLLGGDEP
jgi:hypothetical protein